MSYLFGDCLRFFFFLSRCSSSGVCSNSCSVLRRISNKSAFGEVDGRLKGWELVGNGRFIWRSTPVSLGSLDWILPGIVERRCRYWSSPSLSSIFLAPYSFSMSLPLITIVLGNTQPLIITASVTVVEIEAESLICLTVARLLSPRIGIVLNETAILSNFT